MAKPRVVYLDIETLGPHESPRILSIGVLHEVLGDRSTGTQLIFRAYPSTERDLPKKEERALISFFMQYRRLLSDADGIVFLVGWNLANYDLPLLYHRLRDLGVDHDQLFYFLFHRPHVVDLRQIYVFLKRFYLTGTSQSAVMSEIFNLERLSGGDEVESLYRSGDWDGLDAHLAEDLAFNRALFHAFRSVDTSFLLDEVKSRGESLRRSIERIRSIYGGK